MKHKTHDSQYSEQETANRRDQLLRRLLHMPPQPGPKQEREKSKLLKREMPKRASSFASMIFSNAAPFLALVLRAFDGLALRVWSRR